MPNTTPKELLDYKLDIAKKDKDGKYITIANIKQSDKFPDSLTATINIENLKKIIEESGSYKTTFASVFIKFKEEK